jgi:glycosyltransferase involved in cell wall biosynthesis
LLFYLLLKKSPDYIVAFNLSAYVPLSLVAAFDRNIKLVASEHSTYDAIKSSVIKRIILVFADRYIFNYTILSDRVAKSFPSFVQNKYTAIANPVFVPDVSFVDEIYYDTNFFNVISVGRLSKEKNQGGQPAGNQNTGAKFPASQAARHRRTGAAAQGGSQGASEVWLIIAAG